MNKTGIFYAVKSGTTEAFAKQIAEKSSVDAIAGYQNIILCFRACKKDKKYWGFVWIRAMPTFRKNRQMGKRRKAGIHRITLANNNKKYGFRVFWRPKIRPLDWIVI